MNRNPGQRVVPTLRIRGYERSKAFYVESVDRWFAELSDRKVRIDEAPNEDLQGLGSMGLRDPDGNKLRISTRLTDWVRGRPV